MQTDVPFVFKFFCAFSLKVAIFFKNPLPIRHNCGKIQVCEYVFRNSSAEMIFLEES